MSPEAKNRVLEALRSLIASVEADDRPVATCVECERPATMLDGAKVCEEHATAAAEPMVTIGDLIVSIDQAVGGEFGARITDPVLAGTQNLHLTVTEAWFASDGDFPYLVVEHVDSPL